MFASPCQPPLLREGRRCRPASGRATRSPLLPAASLFSLFSPRSTAAACLFLLLLSLAAQPSLGAAAPTFRTAPSARLVKVLPQFVDGRGRVALNPSLYERDAYQFYLRRHPAERGGLQFQVQWKSPTLRRVTLRLELRGTQNRQGSSVTSQDQIQHRGLLGSWSSITLKEADYRALGELSAWRATLWDGGEMLAEQKSFLW